MSAAAVRPRLDPDVSPLSAEEWSLCGYAVATWEAIVDRTGQTKCLERGCVRSVSPVSLQVQELKALVRPSRRVRRGWFTHDDPGPGTRQEAHSALCSDRRWAERAGHNQRKPLSIALVPSKLLCSAAHDAHTIIDSQLSSGIEQELRPPIGGVDQGQLQRWTPHGQGQARQATSATEIDSSVHAVDSVQEDSCMVQMILNGPRAEESKSAAALQDPNECSAYDVVEQWVGIRWRRRHWAVGHTHSLPPACRDLRRDRALRREMFHVEHLRKRPWPPLWKGWPR